MLKLEIYENEYLILLVFENEYQIDWFSNWEY